MTGPSADAAAAAAAAAFQCCGQVAALFRFVLHGEEQLEVVGEPKLKRGTRYCHLDTSFYPDSVVLVLFQIAGGRG